MKNIKTVLTNYIKKSRFEFENVFSTQRVKEELISTLQEISMFLQQGMEMKQINYIINTQNDDQVSNQGSDVDFKQLIQTIKDIPTENQGENGYVFALNVLNDIFKEI